MEIQRLEFTRDWTNAADFPTIETDETKVRSDMQALYNEIRDYLNDVLSPEVVEEFARFVTTYATKDELDQVVVGVSPDLAATEAALSVI